MKKMKLTQIAITTLIIFVGSSATLMAQNNEFKYGSRIGLGESQLNFSESTTESGKLAFTLGIASTYYFNDYLGASADFLLTSKGGKRDGVATGTNTLGMQRNYDYNDKYRLFYAELPLLVNLRLPITETLYIRGFTGPSINFKLAGTESREYEDNNYNEDNGYQHRSIDDLETIDYSMVYGLGVDVVTESSQTFFLDFRLNEALRSSGRVDNQNVENSYFLISTGYLF